MNNYFTEIDSYVNQGPDSHQATPRYNQDLRDKVVTNYMRKKSRQSSDSDLPNSRNSKKHNQTAGFVCSNEGSFEMSDKGDCRDDGKFVNIESPTQPQNVSRNRVK